MTDIENLQQVLIERLVPLLPTVDISRLRTCRHYSPRDPNNPTHQERNHLSFCNSPFCVPCRKRRASRESALLKSMLQQQLHVTPNLKLAHFTLAAGSCWPSEIGQKVRELRKCWGALSRRADFKKNVLGWLSSIEVKPSQSNTAMEWPHIHVAGIMRPGYTGRNRLSNRDWNALLVGRNGTPILPDIDLVVTSPPLEKLANYVVKHYDRPTNQPFLDALHLGIEEPYRFVERTAQLSGLHRYTAGGRLKESMPSEDEYGLVGIICGGKGHLWARRQRDYAVRHGFSPVEVETPADTI